MQFLVPVRLEDGEHVGHADEKREQRGDGRDPRQRLAAPAWGRVRLGTPVAASGRGGGFAHVESLVRPRITVKQRSHDMPAMRCSFTDLQKILVNRTTDNTVQGGELRLSAFPVDTVPPSAPG